MLSKPCSYPVSFVLSILQQASPPGGLRSASWGQKKGQGINAPGSSPWPWLMKLENKCLGRMYGRSSLSSSVLCLCSWPWLLPWWLFSVKILVLLNTNWVCYARQKYDNQCLLDLTGDASEPQGQYFRVLASHLSSCFSAVPASWVDGGCCQERDSSIHGASPWTAQEQRALCWKEELNENSSSLLLEVYLKIWIIHATRTGYFLINGYWV